MNGFRHTLSMILLLCAVMLLCVGCGVPDGIRLPAVPTLPPKETAPATPAPTVSVKPSLSPAPTPEPSETPEPSPTPEPVMTAPPADPDMPVLTVTGETLPQDMEQLNVADLRGVISVDKGIIKAVYASLVNSQGETVQFCEFYPDSYSFSLGGTVNAEISFIYLEEDTYTYIVEAEAANNGKSCRETLIYHSFSVFARADGHRAAADYSGSGNKGTYYYGTADDEYIAKFTDDRSNAGRIWNFLVYQLKNPYGAAGVLGNIEIESKCDPMRLQGDSSDTGAYSQVFVEQVDSGSIDRAAFIAGSSGDGYGPGFGLCQWSGERKAGLYDLAYQKGTSVGDLEMQCMYILRELRRSYPELLEKLMNASDAGTAAMDFCSIYEQPPTREGRSDKAREYLEKYAKNG